MNRSNNWKIKKNLLYGHIHKTFEQRIIQTEKFNKSKKYTKYIYFYYIYFLSFLYIVFLYDSIYNEFSQRILNYT